MARSQECPAFVHVRDRHGREDRAAQRKRTEIFCFFFIKKKILTLFFFEKKKQKTFSTLCCDFLIAEAMRISAA
jgi:hypothetical protein